MHEIAAQIEDAKARWMTGGSAEAACPAGWKDALGEMPDLGLLLLAGQFTHLAMRPVPGGPLKERAPLPPLALPALPDRLRPDFRRLLASKSVSDSDVVRLIAARGYAVSPIDWMPGANDRGLPEVYTPWLDWLAERPGHEEDAPTAETWEMWSPQARLAHVERLRKIDPDAGRSLIQSVAPALAAEPRLRLVSSLAIGLGDADVPFLTGLQSDKSGKVQALATGLLARLGQAKADAEAAAEMAGFFEKAKAGFLSRRVIVTAAKLKNAAQRRRRAALAETVPFAALAEGLGMPGTELVQAWDFGEGTAEIAAMVTATGSDAEAQLFLERMVDTLGAASDIGSLIDRLHEGKRPALAPQIIARDSATFVATARLLSAAPGTLGLATIRSSGAFRQLEATVAEGTDTTAQAVNLGFANLGLIADREAARGLIDHFTGGGLMSADPRLAMLRLNAGL